MTQESDAMADEIVNGFIRAWTSALLARDHLALAELFHESALFVATTPVPLQGRHQIQTYYERAPVGLRAQAELLCATSPLPGLVHGLVEVVFEAPGGVKLHGRLGVSLVHSRQGWQVSAYQLMANRPASG